MTKGLCKNVKVLTQPCFDKKSVVFKGRPQKQTGKYILIAIKVSPENRNVALKHETDLRTGKDINAQITERHEKRYERF